MRARPQRGATGLMILLIFVLVIVALLASYALSRMSSGGEERAQTTTRLASAALALEQFASTALRLPCPGDPAVDTGLEVQATSATCTHGGGTIPWRTVGLKREDAYDGWGRKISYRVYTGNSGSLTQPGGASMVECDTVEPAPGGVTAGAGSAGGLCRSNADPYQRDTTPAQYLAGKGLDVELKDPDSNFNDVAYVLISHGITGRGAYTASGVRLPLPAGAERDNTRTTGPFIIKAFSHPEVAATANNHFDDLLVYRRIPDFAKRANLEARDWPETVTTAVVFDLPTVRTAISQPAFISGDTGQSAINFSGAVASGLSSGSVASNITYEASGGTGGLGVLGGSSNFLNSGAAESLQVVFTQSATSFGATFSHFGYPERVEFRFYLNDSQVGATVNRTCLITVLDGNLAHFSIPVGSAFNRVDIRPLTSTLSTETSFLVSEVKACSLLDSVCRTGLYQASRECSASF